MALQTLGLVLALVVLAGFDTARAAESCSYVVEAGWVPELGVDLRLGVDGISLPLVVLDLPARLVAPRCTPCGTSQNPDAPAPSSACCCCCRWACSGTFMALDLILFFVFFEVVLAPMWFLIAFWGIGERRRAAANTFILYTVLGSVVMLVGFLVVIVDTGTADMVALAARPRCADVRWRAAGSPRC